MRFCYASEKWFHLYSGQKVNGATKAFFMSTACDTCAVDGNSADSMMFSKKKNGIKLSPIFRCSILGIFFSRRQITLKHNKFVTKGNLRFIIELPMQS